MPFTGQYQPFNIAIEPAQGGYRAQVLDSPEGQTEGFFAPPFTNPPTEWLSGQHPLEEIGGQLFDALFDGPVGEQLRASQARTAIGAGLRINLRLNNAPELAALPWELLYDTTHQRFLALSQRTPVNRYLALPLAEVELVVEPPLRILALLSAPTDYEPQLQVDAEYARLQTALQAPVNENGVVLDKLDNATWLALQSYLRQHAVHILHFVGHGYYDAGDNSGGLIFEDDAGLGQEISARQLASLLHNHSSLRLAVLNACAGAVASSVDPFTGVAQALAQQGLPAVVAMQQAISDQAAILFAETLYAAIADRYPLDAALTQARIALYGKGSQEWATPVLFLRSSNAAIFPPPQEPQPDKTPAVKWHPAGAVWLAVGLAGLVLLVGLGQLYLQGNPLLQGVVGAMVALLGALLGLLGIRNDPTLFPRLSQSVAKLPVVRWGMGGLLALSITLWIVWGINELGNANCHPILGCKPKGEEWFAVAEWKSAGDLTPQEQSLTANMRRAIYQKLNLVDGLSGIDLDSPQLGGQTVAELDIWLVGDYQRFAASQLSAEVNRRGRLLNTVNVQEDVSSQSDEAETICLLDLQNRLALGILEVLEIGVNEQLREAMSRVPTASCTALRLNNEAATLTAQGGSLARAQILLEDALTHDPNYADAYNNLGRVYYLQGEYPQAIEHSQKAIDILPSDALYHANLGLTFERLGNYDAAVTAYSRSLELDRANAQTYNNLGFTYLLRGDLEDAHEKLTVGLELDPNRAELRKNLGRTLLEQDKPAVAVTELERAVELFPAYAEAYYYLALAQNALGETENACNTLLFDYFGLVTSADIDPERFDQAEKLYLSGWQCE